MDSESRIHLNEIRLILVSRWCFICLSESCTAFPLEAMNAKQVAHFAIWSNVWTSKFSLYFSIFSFVFIIWISFKYLKISLQIKRRFICMIFIKHSKFASRTYQLIWLHVNSVSTSFASSWLANLSVSIANTTRISFFRPSKTRSPPW